MLQLRILAATFTIGLVVGAVPAHAADRADPPKAGIVRAGGGTILGSVWDVRNIGVPGALARLRNVTTGKIEATVRADNAGQFTVHNLEGDIYLLEVVNEKGRVLAIGQPFAVAQGETIAIFVRLGAKVPWFTGFFGSAASAVSAAAASAGVTAIAPETMHCASACAGTAK